MRSPTYPHEVQTLSSCSEGNHLRTAAKAVKAELKIEICGITENHTARQTVESLRAIERAKIDSPALKVAAHIAGVSELWLARLEKSSPSLKIWPELTTKAIETIFRDQRGRWLAMCEVNSAETLVPYISSAGGECVNSFAEVVQEVALHGAHHRGQIALLLRIHGAQPPASTDFIPALRDKKALF